MPGPIEPSTIMQQYVMNQSQIYISPGLDNWKTYNRGYVAFTDEQDALLFKLKINTTAIRVLIWPERLFTIHEYDE